MEEGGAAAAAARLCAAEEVHGTLGRAWVGSGSADASEEAPALGKRACNGTTKSVTATKTKPRIEISNNKPTFPRAFGTQLPAEDFLELERKCVVLERSLQTCGTLQ